MTITFSQLPESARWGHSLCLHRVRPSDVRAYFRAGERIQPVEAQARTVEIPIQVYDTGVVRLRVAFDPETQTLYLGTPDPGHALRRAQDEAWALRCQLARVANLLDHLKGDRPSGVRRRAMRAIREAVGL